jgi:hypothetical protein
MKFIKLFYFCGSFLPSWIRIRIRNPDLGTPLNQLWLSQEGLFRFGSGKIIPDLVRLCHTLLASVADPDPNPDPDPRVIGPPGSGSTSQRYGSGSGSCSRSGSFYHHTNSKKNLDSSYFVTLFEFLSLKNDVNVASKSHK